MKKFLCYDTEAAARGEINVDNRGMLKPTTPSCVIINIIRTGPSSYGMDGYTTKDVYNLLRNGTMVFLRQEAGNEMYAVEKCTPDAVYASKIYCTPIANGAVTWKVKAIRITSSGGYDTYEKTLT